MARDQKRHVRSNRRPPEARHHTGRFAKYTDRRHMNASFGQFITTLATELARHDHTREDPLL